MRNLLSLYVPGAGWCSLHVLSSQQTCTISPSLQMAKLRLSYIKKLSKGRGIHFQSCSSGYFLSMMQSGMLRCSSFTRLRYWASLFSFPINIQETSDCLIQFYHIFFTCSVTLSHQTVSCTRVGSCPFCLCGVSDLQCLSHEGVW